MVETLAMAGIAVVAGAMFFRRCARPLAFWIGHMVKLEDVHVSIPVFLNEYSRAIRTSLGERIFGGRLSADRSGEVCVQAPAHSPSCQV